MKLKPSMKLHKRYLLLEASKDEIEKTILDYLGVLGWAKASPFFIKSANASQIIIAVNRKEIENIRAAFALSPFKIKILKVSGTLKGLAK
ncbi:MAG: Rpp14/Pop5 family protein [Nanoarchaeota archaeon]